MILILVVGLVIYSQAGAPQAPPDRKIQILRPHWDVAGKDGAITIITGFTENGQRIVATTDGGGTCDVGMAALSAETFVEIAFAASRPTILPQRVRLLTLAVENGFRLIKIHTVKTEGETYGHWREGPGVALPGAAEGR